MCVVKEFRNSFRSDTLRYGGNVIAHSESSGRMVLSIVLPLLKTVMAWTCSWLEDGWFEVSVECTCLDGFGWGYADNFPFFIRVKACVRIVNWLLMSSNVLSTCEFIPNWVWTNCWTVSSNDLLCGAWYVLEWAWGRGWNGFGWVRNDVTGEGW